MLSVQPVADYPVSNETRLDFTATRPARISQQKSTYAPPRASTAPSIVTFGGDAGLFLDVRDRNPAQRILNDLADHVQLVVAR
jgi:hypothetical protein